MASWAVPTPVILSRKAEKKVSQQGQIEMQDLYVEAYPQDLAYKLAIASELLRHDAKLYPKRHLRCVTRG